MSLFRVVRRDNDVSLRKLIAGAIAALLVGAGLTATAVVAPALAEPPVTYEITADRDQVLQQDFLGIGVNLIPTVLMPNNRSKGYDEALWQIDRERIKTLSPSVARVWFQTDWFESVKGVYDYDTPKMQAFLTYLDALKEADTEVELNFGWKVGRDIQEWFGFEGIDARVSAPVDTEAFAAAASALVQWLHAHDYDNVKYLTFYNEPAGSYDFETPGDVSQVVYYGTMAQAVHDRLVTDGIRDDIEIWGPEEWAAPGWTEYMAREHAEVFDTLSFHVYGGTYASLSAEIEKRTSVADGIPVALTEFGFSGRYDSRWEAGYGSYVIKLANEGMRTGLIWQLNGVWLEDPQEGTDTNSTYTLWDSLAVTRVPNQRFYEAGLLLRYVPAHSQVVATTTGPGGVRAATFLDGDDVTMVVEVDDQDATRQLDIDLGADPGKTVSVFEYSEAITPNASATLPEAVRQHTGQSFTDTVGAGRHVLIYTTLGPQAQVEVTPNETSLTSGSQQQFEAELVDATGDVTWSVAPGDGEITAGGLYTAPVVTEPRRIAVTAAIDGGVSESATVLVSPAHVEGRADVPVFSMPGGDYVGTQDVTVTSATPDAAIHYTTDGTEPTAESPQASGPIAISSSAMLKAITIADGLESSATASAFYRIMNLPAGPDGFTFCSNQDQVCGFTSQAAYVSYGAPGGYVTGLFSQWVKCDTSIFGVDPAPGQTKRCFVQPYDGPALTAMPSATPNGGEFFTQSLTVTLSVPEGSTVYYTASGALPTTSSTVYTPGTPIAVPTSRVIKAIAVKEGVSSPILLANYTITDPFPGPSGYTYCNSQGYTCVFTGTAYVAYGAWGNFNYGVYTDGVTCAAANFDGNDPSPGNTKKCYYKVVTGEVLLKPTFSPAPGTLVGAQSITISAAEGASIHYTLDGSTPTVASPSYTAPIALTAPSTTTIKAIAVKAGIDDSLVATGTFQVQVDPNLGAPDGYTYCASQGQTCAITAPSSVAYGFPGYSFNYANHASSITCNSTNIPGPDPAFGQTKRCYTKPTTEEPEPGQVAVPTFTPGAGTYATAQSVTISSATADAEIHYTTDGSTPTAASPVYSSPVTVEATTTLKAIAVKAGMTDSTVGSATFTIQPASSGPDGYTHCADQHYTCELPGPATVAYGLPGFSYNYLDVYASSVVCNSTNIPGPDPASGQSKKCYYKLLPVVVDQVAPPVLGPAPGTYNTATSVTMTSSTSGAAIHYTLDGSTPTSASPLYSGPVALSASATVKAIAVKDGMADSGVTSAVYTLHLPPAGYTYCADQHYECTLSGPSSVAFGLNGTFNYAEFSSTVTCNSTNIPGPDPAPGFGKKCYQRLIAAAAAPFATPAGGSYTEATEVTLSSSTPDAVIRYTLDGSEPTEASTEYTAPLTLTAGTTTLKAIAFAAAHSPSAVTTEVYEIAAPAAVETPTFSPGAGTYASPQSVTIASATEGATIHYTLDGSTPTASSPVYSAPLEVSTTTTVKAIAVKDGATDSEIGEASFTIEPASTGPDGYTFCADQHYTCELPGPATVAYGAPGHGYNYADIYAESVVCNETNIPSGDPAPGQSKKCYFKLLPVVVDEVAVPVITPGTGSFNAAPSVTITTATEGASIHYTLDGSTPTTASALYTGAFSVTESATVKAIAVKDGLSDSPVAQAVYTVNLPPAGYTYCADQHYECTLTGPSSVAYGLNGTFNYAEFSSTVTCSSENIPGPDPAPGFGKKCYQRLLTAAAAPEFTPAGGTYDAAQSVELVSGTPGAVIRYTTDGTEPTEASTEYTGPIEVASSVTITAIAFAAGYTPSPVSSAAYSITPAPLPAAAAPEFSPAPGTYTGSVTVTLTSTTAGAVIRYTTDGTEPDAGSAEYVGGIVLGDDAVVKAVAFAAGHSPSSVASASYTVTPAPLPVTAAPVASLAGGSYSGAQTVTLSSSTPEAVIRYTLDGSAPHAGSTAYSGPIDITATATLRAIASAPGHQGSTETLVEYTIVAAGDPGAEDPIDESELTDETRGGVETDGEASPGDAITVDAGAENAGAEVYIWLHSTPRLIAHVTLDANGRAIVAIPNDAALGAHRVVLLNPDGSLLGWAPLNLVSPSGGAGAHPATGVSPAAGLAAALVLLLMGGVLAGRVVVRRRTLV